MTPESFVWGRGGRRLTPEDIARQRQMAEAQMSGSMDFSPVGHWTQGLARLANGVSGRIQGDRIAEAEQANRAESQSVMQALMAGGSNPATDRSAVLAALANPYLDNSVRQVAGAELERMNAPPAAAVIQHANNGDILGLDPITGEVRFTRVDPNPKPALDWMSMRNEDGTTTFVPVGAGGPILQGGGGPTSGAVPRAGPPATLPPDFDFGEQRGPASAPGTFPR